MKDADSMGYDHWCSPPDLIKALGAIDTDPCWNPGSFVEASVTYSGSLTCVNERDTHSQHTGICPACAKFGNGQNGLVELWYGRTFVNCGYSYPEPWAQRWCHHARQGIPGAWLCETQFGTNWASLILKAAQCVYIFDARLKFWDPVNQRFGRSPRSGHMLALSNWEVADIEFFESCATKLLVVGG